jgi:hypothetical protein
MPLNAPAVAPPPVNIQAVPGVPAPMNAPSVAPPQINVSAQQMPPTVFVGFKLAKKVLAIAAGSIVLLLLYLFAMEWMIGSDVRQAYKRILSPSRVGAEFQSIAQLEKFAADLSDARKNPKVQWTNESLQNGQDLLKLVDELPSITADKKAYLKDCVPPPPVSDASRDNKLDGCLGILSGIKQAALEAAAAATDEKVAADSAGKIGEQRQSLHLFWVQVAQLILLNLLLPLLTALFGYIFGTQQVQRSA